MPYYVWKRGGKIVAHDYAAGALPPPAIRIGDEEAKELGIFSPPPVAAPEPAEQPPTVEELQAELAATQRKLDAAIHSNAMLEDCIVEMAQVVYA